MDYKQQQEIIKYLARLEKQLIKVYGDTYKAAIDITDVRKAIESGGTFTWSDNRQAAAKLDKMLRQMTQKVETLIANGIGSCYRQGERNVTGDVIKALGVRGKAQTAEVTAICDAATDQRRANGQSAAAHINARRGGIQASAQIWQQNAKKEIEIIVQNGMKEGKNPSEIAQSIRSYLKEPYRYEKSVYNPTTGRLERSDAAKDYHPGQGVYRSSYKNALRMARTEMTQAYRQAEWESYQNNPLIKAYEIRLSGNHTTMKTVKGKRVPVPLTDICDKLAGVYPKTFKWVGWHPQCRCLMIPITVSKSEFRELLEARKADREARKAGKEATAVAKINQRAANVPVPKQYNDWLAANQDRINAARKGGGILPMWITDNTTMPTTITTVTATGTVETSTLTPQQIAAKRHAARTKAEIDDILKRWNDRKEKAIPAELRTGGTYLAPGEEGFDAAFFKLIDPKKPIKLRVENNDKGSYSSFTGNEVVIRGLKRGQTSPWEHRSVIYHEYGHCIDAQRRLWQDKALLDLRAKQIADLKKKGTYTIWERDWVSGKGFVWRKTTTTMTKVAYIDKKLEQLGEKIFNTSGDSLKKLGISKHDVLEQIGCVRDTIKSLVIKYGCGHSTAYFKKPRMQETEYLAHAFENTFIGNAVFKKYLPDIYQEMIDYIKALKPMQ